MMIYSGGCAPKRDLETKLITRAQAVAIAMTEAKKVYQSPRELEEAYVVEATLADDVWRVDFELKDPDANGGGPHYLIDAKTGRVLHTRLVQ
jgi:Zn-dependent metalloprotease